MTKLKKKAIKHNLLIMIILWILIIVIFSSINIIKINYHDLVYKESISIKIGEELPTINDYVDSENLKKLDDTNINWENIDTSDNKIYSSGEYTGYITYREEKKILKLIVIDDEKPKIEGVKDITIYKNESIDLLKNIKVTDNSSDDIEINVIGEYDTSKVGEYNLSYKATDKSNNEEIANFKLIVKEKVTTTSNSETITVGTTSKGYTIQKINGMYYIDGVLIANKTYSLPSSYNPGGLLSIFTTAFNTMKNDASKEGINLYILSGYRSYSSQKTIYNNYVNKDGKASADTYSARPGYSEHQTALTADINSLYTSFINTKEGKWLNDNCYKYGFIIRYPQGKENYTGYIYEPWHIRYVGTTLATTLYNNGDWISLEEYFGITSQYSD
jgi:D-alanyl-D-alanine carboxypeptidase